MDFNSDNMLAIGSVVKLKGADILAMIVGYGMATDKQYYDYLGVLYPNGLSAYKDYLYFNVDEIDNVVFSSYKDESYESLRKVLPERLNIIKKEINK